MTRRADINSILLLSVGPLLMGPASAQGMRVPAPTHEQTIMAIAACGVPPENIRIAYEDELQSDVVTISDLGRGGKTRIRCVRNAVDVSYIVMIEAEDQRRDYYAMDGGRARIPGSRRPFFQARLRDIAVGCGLPARVLGVTAAGRVRFRPPPDVRYEAVDCALARMRQAGLLRYMPMAFVGNETQDTGNQ